VSARGFLSLLPNIITLARLLAVPVTVYLMLQGFFGAAFWVFIAAGVSDAVDGFLAKRMGAVSEIGAYMDPLADKALLVSVFVTLGYIDHVATWLVILIVFRDLLIIGGAILFQTITQSLEMKPLFISKINTAAQILLAGVVLAELGLGPDMPVVSTVLVYGVAATTFLSGAAYVVKWGWMAIMMESDQ
jgi:cardiolipin synthase